MPIINAKLEQQQETLNQMQLALTGNLTQLRDHLKDGSECPLCGSTHHHYSKLEDSTIDSVFKEVKQRYDDLDNESKSLNNRDLKIEYESGNLEIRSKENKNKRINTKINFRQKLYISNIF